MSDFTKADAVATHGKMCPACLQSHLCIQVSVRVPNGWTQSIFVELCSQVSTHTLYASGSGYLAGAVASAGTIAKLVQAAIDAHPDAPKHEEDA